ncbi:MAG: phosphate acetyltransferase [Dehalococcoidia bacterium]|nr:phosphate acetyltransferase [Dehalococcoidia bacterium]
MAKKNLMTKLQEKVKLNPKKIIFPEGEETRILKAVEFAVEQELCFPFVLGNREAVSKKAVDVGVSLQGIEVIDPALSPELERYVDIYTRSSSISSGAAARLIKRPIYYGAMMVRSGDVDGMVAGAVYETSTVIMASQLAVGMKEGITTPSSYFIMDIPGFEGGEDGVLIFADCAVNADPSAEELADIAIASADTAKAILGCEARVAMLSFSTKGSSIESPVEKVIIATEMVKERRPDILVDGELQLDAAIVEAVAKKKIKDESPVAGKANTLIFPDLNSGNIGYKLTQRLAKAAAYGPMLQGFAMPVSDLSRGAEVVDIVGALIITSAQVK